MGGWTTIRQDVWLNTPAQNDGGFNIWINGRIVMTASDVRYRENAYLCLTPLNADEEFPGEMAADDESDANHSTYLDEDWQLPKNSEYPSPARNVLGSSVMRRVLKKSNCTGVVDQDGEWFVAKTKLKIIK